MHGLAGGAQATLGLAARRLAPRTRRGFATLRRLSSTGLYRELDAEIDGERTLLHLQSLDDYGGGDLQNGDIVELTGTLQIPDVAKAIGAMQGFGSMLPLFKSLQQSGDHTFGPGKSDGECRWSKR